MNRRILIQVTAPTVVIGLLLFGTCAVSAWYANRQEADLVKILRENVANLRAVEQMEVNLRRLRFHCFRYLIEPKDAMLKRINGDEVRVLYHLDEARGSARTPEAQGYVRAIEEGYQKYREEFDRERADLIRQGQPRRDFDALAEANPVDRVIEPCQELLQANENAMTETLRQSERLGGRLRLALLLLGLGGPLSGLIMGYGMARGLSRSIYQLSVRVQDMAQRLDQDVASVSIAADGDIQSLDQQLQHVVERVEEVAERLQRHQREMLRAEQLAAVGQLAAGVAHEVRNPLMAIKLLVQSALHSQNRKPLTVQDLNIIHGELDRLEQTVQNFLDFARPPSPRRSVCDLRDVVVQAAELVRARARKHLVELTTDCGDVPLPADVDRNQLATVLVNLFLNALDAMPAGGRLEVELTSGAEGEVQLRVADTGEGIAPEMAGRLFTPFASTKPTGTGLGLSICRRIVEEHGGRISAENRPERGACFIITLPATAHGVHHADAASH